MDVPSLKTLGRRGRAHASTDKTVEVVERACHYSCPANKTGHAKPATIQTPGGQHGQHGEVVAPNQTRSRFRATNRSIPSRTRFRGLSDSSRDYTCTTQTCVTRRGMPHGQRASKNRFSLGSSPSTDDNPAVPPNPTSPLSHTAATFRADSSFSTSSDLHHLPCGHEFKGQPMPNLTIPYPWGLGPEPHVPLHRTGHGRYAAVHSSFLPLLV
ncbi:hypothetical protein B0T24DRAFT_172678 [Lasiosphaeria ovina]|uniref:Uncharacterized protein n=1 Tax=Lasiosphaeria ovina TaxID=92902 RepID=A0AAE0TT43_9PEZI|nr:hypothetical protein B0T24DRAFT_172678 [Lasiosphaeria ovina]